MPLVANFPTLKLRAAPVAEVSSFVATTDTAELACLDTPYPSASPRRMPKRTNVSEPRTTGAKFAKSSSGIDCQSRDIAHTDQSARALELLRHSLSLAVDIAAHTAEILPATEQKPPKLEHSTKNTKSPDSAQRLGHLRQELVALLRESHSPQAEQVEAISALLANRTELGLLDPSSAREYNRQSEHEASLSIPTSSTVDPCDGILSSSFDSEETATTLDASVSGTVEVPSSETTPASAALLASIGDEDEADSSRDGIDEKRGFIENWVNNEFWRGVSTRSWMRRHSRRRASVSSEKTLVSSPYTTNTNMPTGSDQSTQTALSDTFGVCWPLDTNAKDAAARSWARFYADLGDVRIPSRFRTPERSLNMLATEQLMMTNDKIVCPLKNRIQEVNPRRQQFEEYIRATGSIPHPSFTAGIAPSALRSEL